MGIRFMYAGPREGRGEKGEKYVCSEDVTSNHTHSNPRIEFL